MVSNPLVVGRVETATALSGAGLLEDGEMLVSAISSGSFLEGGMAVLSAGLDVAAAAIDPIGTLISWGVGWLLDHLEPLKGWLNEFTGDAGAVMGGAQTWANIGESLGASAESLMSSLTATLGEMTSVAVDAYKASVSAVAEHVAMVASLSGAISTGLGVASTIVQVVHDLVRDVIAQIVGSLLSAIIEMIASVGTLAPKVIASMSMKVSAMSAKVSKTISKATGAFSKLSTLFKQSDTLLGSLRGKFDEMFQAAGRGGDNALAAAGRSGDNAAAAASRSGDSAAAAARQNPDGAARPGSEIPQKGDPVDVATGQVFLDRSDVYLAGVLPLVVTRRYVSGFGCGRSFGRRWASTLDEHVETNLDSTAVVRGDGSILLYPHLGVGDSAVPQAGPDRWCLTRTGLDSYELVDPVSGRVRFFEGTGRQRWITELRDRAGHWVRYERDPRGVCQRIVHHGGYQVDVESQGSRVTGLVVGGEPVVRFDYLGGVLVAEHRGTSGVLRYVSDTQERMTAWIDSLGVQYLYFYDDEGRCVRQGLIDGDDPVMRFSYSYVPGPLPGGWTTTLYSADGSSEVFIINDRKQITAEINPLGGETCFEFDEFNRRVQIVDPLGGVTRYSYDDDSRLIRIVNPSGGTINVSFDEAGLPIRMVDPAGHVTSQVFDGLGRIVEQVAPGDGVTRWEYPDEATVTVIDPSHRSTTVMVNPAGLPVQVMEPNGAMTRLIRDGLGRVVAETDPLGHTTSYTWSVVGELLSRTDPLGAVERWAYDGESNLVQYQDRHDRVTRYTYGAFDVCTSQTKPDGSRLWFSYDPQRRLTQVTNENGQTWTYTRDQGGYVVAETDYDGRTTTYTRNLCGQITSVTNPVGQVITYTYTPTGDLAGLEAGGGRTTFTHDVLGRVIAATNPWVSMTRAYDVAGNLTSETVTPAGSAQSHTMRYTYDQAGRTLSRTTPAGSTSAYTHDQVGNITTLTLDNTPVEYRHDLLGRITGTRFSGGTVMSQYTPTGQLAHRTTTPTGPERPWVSDYAYTPTGELAASKDTRYGLRSYTLDPVGQITAVITDSVPTEAYTYDPAGNITHATWAAPTSDPAQGERAYQGTLLTRAGADHYTYDQAGRLTARTRKTLSGATKTWHFTWDAHDHLTQVTVPDGTTWTYAYDPYGRRVSKTHHDHTGTPTEHVHFTWDGSVLTEQTITTPAGWTTTTWEHHGYTPTTQTTRTGNRTQASYDAEFALIISDHIGTPHHLLTHTGHTTPTGTTTLWGKTHTTTTPLRFPGQYLDTETGLHYNHHRYYNPDTGRYTTQDPLGLVPTPNPTTYPHNPTRYTDPHGLAPYPSKDGDPDPLVPEVVNAIDKRYPGHVIDVGRKVYRDDGTVLTDLDVLVRNAIIEVKSGKGKGLTAQVERLLEASRNKIPEARDLPVVVFGPDLGKHVTKGATDAGALVVHTLEDLLELIKP